MKQHRSGTPPPISSTHCVTKNVRCGVPIGADRAPPCHQLLQQFQIDGANSAGVTLRCLFTLRTFLAGLTPRDELAYRMALIHAVKLGRNPQEGGHLIQARLYRSAEPGQHVAEVDVIPAEAVPVITAATAKQRRHGSAVRHRAIAQDRQIEAAAIEADQHRPLAGVVARQPRDEVAGQIGLALFADMPGAETAHDVGAVVLALGEQRADADDAVERRLEKDLERRLAISAVALADGFLPVQPMTLEHWPIDRLIEYARNPRKNDAVVDRMCAAITEFGFRIPIIAKSDGTVVDGHLRLKAAKRLGLAEVPVVLADELTDVQIKAFRLLANRSVAWAEWDDELLRLEIAEIVAADFDTAPDWFR